MFKYILFAALLALAVAEPDAKAKPAVVAAYSAPVVGAPYAYSAYSAYVPSAPVVSPYAYPYAAPVVY